MEHVKGMLQDTMSVQRIPRDEVVLQAVPQDVQVAHKYDYAAIRTKVDRREFATPWKQICGRHGKTVEVHEAAAFIDFFEKIGMTTQDVLGAAGAVWATSTFMPRPVDFPLVRAKADWPIIVEAADTMPPAGMPVPEEWHDLWRSVHPRSRAVVKQIGGLTAIAGSPKRDLLRKSYLSAYEDALATEAMR